MGSSETAQVEQAAVLRLDAAERQAVRRRAHQRLAGSGRLLQPRGHVHRLAGRERRVGVVGDHLARLEPHPGLEAERLHRVEDRERRAHAALGVVLVRLGDAERRHHGVAGELLDDPAVGDHAVRDAVEEPRHAAPHDLRIAGGNEPGGVDEVDEEDCRELPFHHRIVRAAPHVATPRDPRDRRVV